jgi:hypothetical protein
LHLPAFGLLYVRSFARTLFLSVTINMPNMVNKPPTKLKATPTTRFQPTISRKMMIAGTVENEPLS